MKDFKGFTLAEVLITLSILGVVAVIMIQNVTSHYRKTLLLTYKKKNYSVLDNAFEFAKIYYGDPSTWDGLMENPLTGGETSVSRAFANKFKQSLNIVKDCDTNVSECWDYEPKNIDGTSHILQVSDNRYRPSVAYKLKDGTNLLFVAVGSGMNLYPTIVADLNGKKGPNRLGIDIFMFSINLKVATNNPRYGKLEGFAFHHTGNIERNKLFNGSADACKHANNATAGAECSALVILDGFKFADDYPVKF